MLIAGIYSFNHGEEVMRKEHPRELQEIFSVIERVNARELPKKIGKEKTNYGENLYSPRALNVHIKKYFSEYNWENNLRVQCNYPTEYYTNGYSPSGDVGRNAYREMDFVKNQVGIEVQFGKYAFMVYNVAAKMTIFHNLGYIDVGVEIVAVKEMASEMSTGVSYFEQFLWDLEKRGEADIDIPVLILGIAPQPLA